MKKEELKRFLKKFYYKNIDFEIIEGTNNEKFIWFHNPNLLKKVTNKKYLLKEFKEEYPDVQDEKQLIDLIAGYIVREAIVINEKEIDKIFFEVFS